MESKNTEKQICYCNSGLYYEICCKPFIDYKELPKTAEQLMRSRYTAFCIKDADYIKNTMHGRALELHDEESILNSPIQWKKLEILNKKKGKQEDEEGIVTFRAIFQKFPDKDQLTYIEEQSLFKKIDNKWFYTDLIPINE